MKKLKDIKEEIANVSSGLGVRGFGDVSGTPSINYDEEENNPHIQRVVAGALEHQALVDKFINGVSVLDEPNQNWWAKPGAKGSSLTAMGKPISTTSKAKSTLKEGMEKDHYKAIDDVHVNLDNRNHAIEEYGYGPLNPNEESADFWKEKAKLWETSVDEAKKSRCGNCAAFNKSKEITNRISQNLGPAGKKITEKADLGFCEMFHFKCAAARTCDAWLVNGPIMEQEGASAAGGIANVTGAAVPGTGDDPQAFPRANNKYKKQNLKDASAIQRRLAPLMVAEEEEKPKLETGKFAGHTTFKVSDSDFDHARNQKAKGVHWKTYMKNSPHYEQIRSHARKNPKSPIIFEHEKTGYMFYAKYGKERK